MQAYLNLAKTVLSDGILKENRTGIDTLSCFSCHFKHDLKEGFPLLTTKKMDGKLWNSVVQELLWFISGENHIRNLRKQTGIWDAWADENGNLESCYGFYWRKFPHTGGKMIEHANSVSNDECGNFDQLGYCVEQLKKNPNNRRLIVSAWEPYNAHKSKLPPCHILYAFNVQNGRLCLHMTQRSADIFLGVPFNIASYALLLHIVAREVGLEPGVLSMLFVDLHAYHANPDDQTLVNGFPRCEYDHTKVLKEQLQREPYQLPSIEISGGPWDRHVFEDFRLVGYQSHGLLKGRVAV